MAGLEKAYLDNPKDYSSGVLTVVDPNSKIVCVPSVPACAGAAADAAGAGSAAGPTKVSCGTIICSDGSYAGLQPGYGDVTGLAQDQLAFEAYQSAHEGQNAGEFFTIVGAPIATGITAGAAIGGCIVACPAIGAAYYALGDGFGGWSVRGAVSSAQSRINYRDTLGAPRSANNALGAPRIASTLALSYLGRHLEARASIAYRGSYLIATPPRPGATSMASTP